MVQKSVVGESAAHRQILEKLSEIATTDAEVLISGRSDVGKEFYARYIHQSSPRSVAPFVPINCGALSADLLENELFGYVRGAFMGARPPSDGLVAAAEGGTLFLDEVDSLAPVCQVKLLRFLQEKEYRRLGETRIRRANVRIIAATNTDLLAAVHDGRFREDLFLRLRVVPIEVPVLCEQPSDIPLLLSEHVTRYTEAYKLPQITFNAATLEQLKSYAWPDNERELGKCVNYLIDLLFNGPFQPSDLPLLHTEEHAQTRGPSDAIVQGGVDRQVTNANPDLTIISANDTQSEVVDNCEYEHVEGALQQSGKNIIAAAQQGRKLRGVFFAASIMASATLCFSRWAQRRGRQFH
jgi:transcriptional regulator with GAF, ATPase, and Fis domain